MTTAAEDYWQLRSHSIYLQVVRQLVSGLGENADSIIDIGSAGCPYLDWFDWIPRRTSVDLENPYKASGVTSFQADFFDWIPDRRYDIATCMQVLEHIPDAEAFAQKLLTVADIVVISVPYKWKPGGNKTHVHDPVDEDKVRGWFQRQANFSYLCREVVTDSRRLINVYERGADQRWNSLKARARAHA